MIIAVKAQTYSDSGEGDPEVVLCAIELTPELAKRIRAASAAIAAFSKAIGDPVGDGLSQTFEFCAHFTCYTEAEHCDCDRCPDPWDELEACTQDESTLDYFVLPVGVDRVPDAFEIVNATPIAILLDVHWWYVRGYDSNDRRFLSEPISFDVLNRVL